MMRGGGGKGREGEERMEGGEKRGEDRMEGEEEMDGGEG